MTSVVNPSSATGGTLVFDSSSPPDASTAQHLLRVGDEAWTTQWAMPMFTFKACPGTCATIVPDLATDMGTVSSDGLTWTFHIKPNVKYEDGTDVKSSDVKYALERTFDRSVMANGPTYYQVHFADNKYAGSYKDRART